MDLFASGYQIVFMENLILKAKMAVVQLTVLLNIILDYFVTKLDAFNHQNHLEHNQIIVAMDVKMDGQCCHLLKVVIILFY